MFDKLKQLKELQELQKKIKSETLEHEESGVRVKMNGAFEVLELALNPDLALPAQEEAVKRAVNAAREKIQRHLAKNFAGSLF
jgi:DNA-binding protein YbaB